MDAMYNCRKNTYTIVRDGKTYNIKPLPKPKKEREPLAIIVGEKEILKEIKKKNRDIH